MNINKTTFEIKKMDCPSEEQLIRMKLDQFQNIQDLQFDIPNRRLSVIHSEESDKIYSSIQELKLSAAIIKTELISDFIKERNENERSVLIVVLLINFSLFLVEIAFGFFSHSMGLIADSLDMLADAIVYGMSLYAVGSAIQRKHKIAELSGYFQLMLAIFGFVEILRRFYGYDNLPEFRIMIIISMIALTGNMISLILLQRHRSNEAHMKASWIFTTNDIVVNFGVIIAGALVFISESRIPDLIIGAIIFGVVARGAIRILKLSKN